MMPSSKCEDLLHKFESINYEIDVLNCSSIAIRFKDKYERQILAGTDKNASDRQKRIGIAVAEV
jgi:hypothetical protein